MDVFLGATDVVTNKSGLYGSDESHGNSVQLEAMKFSVGEYRGICFAVVTSIMLPWEPDKPESPSQPKSEIEQACFNWKMKWKQQLSLDPASSVIFHLMSKVQINGSMKLESFFVFDAVFLGQVGGFCISRSGVFLHSFSSYLLLNIKHNILPSPPAMSAVIVHMGS